MINRNSLLATLSFFVPLLPFDKANATDYTVTGTNVAITATSQSFGDALMIESTVGIVSGSPHGICGNKIYIDYADKEAFAIALAANISGKTVTIHYKDNAAYKNIAGTSTYISCKVIAITRNYP